MSEESSGTILITTEPNSPEPKKWAPLALGFRPFFLLGIWFAVLLMLVSIGGFTTGIWHYNYFELPLWHAHEMVFGYATAIIAGFLLTSARNWTGLPTPSGKSLALLVLLWLIPRLLSAVPIPGLLFALLDLAFLPVLAVILARLLVKAGQAHNYPVPLLWTLLVLCNATVHLELLGFVEGLSSQAMQIATLGIIALIAVIAGRVVPFFMQGAIGSRPEVNRLIERLALPSVLLTAGTIISGSNWLIFNAALLTALIHAIRLFSWFDRNILSQPMLWVLHAGYAWLVAGFVIFGFATIMDVPAMHAVHAWTVGAIGMFTLGMMARVALGHTGRAIVALPWMPTAFVLLFMAASSRVALPWMQPEWFAVSLQISAVCWIAAFMIVGLRYSSMLLKSRVDGKEG